MSLLDILNEDTTHATETKFSFKILYYRSNDINGKNG
jgi:hypothetical protein